MSTERTRPIFVTAEQKEELESDLFGLLDSNGIMFKTTDVESIVQSCNTASQVVIRRLILMDLLSREEAMAFVDVLGRDVYKAVDDFLSRVCIQKTGA
jgi:hypothetical protein